VKPFRLDRRTVLRGAGSVAIALPWLEAMSPIEESRAAGAAAKRFVAVYTPGGTTPSKFTPTGTETDFKLGPILTPLEPHQNKLVVLQGLDMKCKSGEQDQAGMVAWLTGREQQLPAGNYPDGPASIDQELAAVLGTPVLYQAVRWGTGKGASSGTPTFINTVSYRFEKDAYQLMQPDIDPVATFERLFGKPVGDSPWRRSILDGVLERYQRLSAKLGTRDRRALEQHMDMLRELEKQVGSTCVPPPLVDTTGYDPFTFDTPSATTDALIPRVGKLMMDMLVAALACDLTNVATLQWADSHAGFTLPWLDLDGNEVQNCYEDNCGYHEPEMTKIFTWYATQHAYLLSAMDQIDRGGHTLLDESVVFFGSHVGYPPEHTNTNMPFLLAGGGGGLVGNRYRNYSAANGSGRSHNDLLVSILELFGDAQATWGNPQFNTGALGNLTTF
jgi:hypothetical protein